MPTRHRPARNLQLYRVTFAVSNEVSACETVVAESEVEAELIVARMHPDTVPRFDKNLAVQVEVVGARGS